MFILASVTKLSSPILLIKFIVRKYSDELTFSMCDSASNESRFRFDDVVSSSSKLYKGLKGLAKEFVANSGALIKADE